MTEIEGKIPSITGLAITAAGNDVENKIPDVSNLVNILWCKNKYFTSSDYNGFANEINNKIKENKLRSRIKSRAS